MRSGSDQSPEFAEKCRTIADMYRRHAPRSESPACEPVTTTTHGSSAGSHVISIGRPATRSDFPTWGYLARRARRRSGPGAGTSRTSRPARRG